MLLAILVIVTIAVLARTGLAAVVTAMLFAASLFVLPLVEPLQRLRFAYAPALVAVGLLMLGEARRIDHQDLTELSPAIVTIAMMVFTYSIGNGLTAELVLHPLVKVAAAFPRGVGWRLGPRRIERVILRLRSSPLTSFHNSELEITSSIGWNIGRRLNVVH